MPDYEPYPPPTPAPDAKRPEETYTDAQRTMHDALLAHFGAPTYHIPPGAGVKEGEGALTETEKFWLSRECLFRYLRASKWQQDYAIQRLENTLRWRRDFGLYSHVTGDHVSKEGLTGKEQVFGYDALGRPAFYMLPSRQNTEEGQGQLEYNFFLLERCIDLMPPGVETLALMINYMDKAKNPSFAQSRKVLSIIQDHYPERLGRAYILNIPWLLKAFFNLIMPFVDPVSRAKTVFNPRVAEDGHFSVDQLMTSWGGTRELDYDHARYWPALLKLCEERERRWQARWRELGASVGVSEWDYKTGSGA